MEIAARHLEGFPSKRKSTFRGFAEK